MDPFALVIVAGVVAVVAWVVLASRLAGTRAIDPLGQRSRRELHAHREALDAEDLDQLLELTNARRRARGEPERTRDDVEREYGR